MARRYSADVSTQRWRLALAVCLVLLAGACAVAGMLVTQTGPFARTGAEGGSAGALNAVEQEVDESALTASTSKLAGATETVDENGVVHGTSADGVNYLLWGRGESGASSDKVTLAAVGDQLGTDSNFGLARSYGSRIGASYDYTGFYQEVAQYIQQADLRFMNQETVCAGGDVSGYPVFNSPDACIDAIANVGFNVVNFCSNHTWDQGSAGIERTRELFAQHPEILVSGSYASSEDKACVRMVERNGMTFAFLSYTCVDNWYNSSTAPNDYYLSYADKDVMETEIRRAQQVADVVIVYMHWGTEYTYDLNDEQLDYAQFLADLDVDLVLGSHNHNVQPTKYITGASGHVTPVVFGLSDFVSGWTLVDTIYSGIFTCDFVRQEDGSVAIENLLWYPTIEWSNGGDVYVRRLCDMTQEEMDSSTRIIDIGESYYEYLVNAINSCGMEIPVVL